MQQKIDLLKQQQKLKAWFADRPALAKSVLEREAGLTPRSLHTFLNKDFAMSEENFQKLLITIKKYGWK